MSVGNQGRNGRKPD